MKRNPDFLLRNVAGKLVLVPVGKAATAFPGMITVNQTGQFIWEQLVEAITQRYEVSAETAAKDAEVFLERLRMVQAITE